MRGTIAQWTVEHGNSLNFWSKIDACASSSVALTVGLGQESWVGEKPSSAGDSSAA